MTNPEVREFDVTDLDTTMRQVVLAIGEDRGVPADNGVISSIVDHYKTVEGRSNYFGDRFIAMGTATEADFKRAYEILGIENNG